VKDILKELKIESTEYLMSRERLGIPLKEKFVEKLKLMTEETLVIDMDGIIETTTSVAEEIGPRLFEEFLSFNTKSRTIYLTYCNLSGEVRKGLDGIYMNYADRNRTQQPYSIVVFDKYENGEFIGPNFIGETIPEALQDILNIIYTLGKAGSGELELNGIKAASRKLNQLSNEYPWLIHKTQESLASGPRAWAYFYTSIVPIAGQNGG